MRSIIQNTTTFVSSAQTDRPNNKNTTERSTKFTRNPVAKVMIANLVIPRRSEECEKVFNELSKPYNTVEDIE
jgi:hypothetical protein